ncbi:NIF domain protein [Podospora conica]|nr:NIF domain protein [Schizothecium conicum]
MTQPPLPQGKRKKRKSKAEKKLIQQQLLQQSQPQDQQNPQQQQEQEQHHQQQDQPQPTASLAERPPARPPASERPWPVKKGQRTLKFPNDRSAPRPPPPPKAPRPSGPPSRDRDAILPPSAESGGIPDPTPSYLSQASQPPRPARKPQPLLVVIDLNGTLLFRPNPRAPSFFHFRPHAVQFLLDCLDAFYVVVWSSARPANVTRMVERLLPELPQRRRLLAAWGRERFNLSPEDYDKRTQCYKRLSVVWGDARLQAAHPLPGGRWSQENTVLIDDSAEKARSEPFNAVTIPEFRGQRGNDDMLPLVHEYLCILSTQADVSAFMRAHPFKADQDVMQEYMRSATEEGEPEGGAKVALGDGSGCKPEGGPRLEAP